jgi:hypothetical protein
MMNSSDSATTYYERLVATAAEAGYRIVKCNASKGCKPFLNKILNSVVNDVIFGKEEYMAYRRK